MNIKINIDDDKNIGRVEAHDDKRRMGYAKFSLLSSGIFIDHVHVDRRYEGLGIGRRLLAEVVRQARCWIDVERVGLSVSIACCTVKPRMLYLWAYVFGLQSITVKSYSREQPLSFIEASDYVRKSRPVYLIATAPFDLETSMP